MADFDDEPDEEQPNNENEEEPSEPVGVAPMAPPKGYVESKYGPMNKPLSYYGGFSWREKDNYCGLNNQGATCYLNSLIQCLYMTPEFRHELFEWKYRPSNDIINDKKYEYIFEYLKNKNKNKNENNNKNDEIKTNDIKPVEDKYDPPPEHCMPFQLQCLFARLKTSRRSAVSTKALTKSFHWDESESFRQNDVQELLRVMMDAIARSLQKWGKENALNQLFEGEMQDAIECQKCKKVRGRTDKFLDLSLPIETLMGLKMKTLEESIKSFTAVEEMKGENQIYCDNCGDKQDSLKGLKFKKLPPLLFIQLKRFTFSYQVLRRVKLSHKVDFPEMLDMSSYVVGGGTTKEDEYKYELYGIIIQSGGAMGGHYYAFIKDLVKQNGKNWYKFNDSSVSEIDPKSGEFAPAYGGDKVGGTGYVLLYRKYNKKLPENYENNYPTYLNNMIKVEDELAKIAADKWEKEQRSFHFDVYINRNNLEEKANDKELEELKSLENWEIEETDMEKEIRYYRIEELKRKYLYKKQVILIDPIEFTFKQFHKKVRETFGIHEKYPINNTRLVRWYKNYKFFAESYTNWDPKNIEFDEDILMESLKLPKKGVSLMLQVAKSDKDKQEWKYFDPNYIMIKLKIITEYNMAEIVEKGFTSASMAFEDPKLNDKNLDKTQTTCIIDRTCSIDEAKKIILEELKSKNMIPKEWGDKFSINLIQFGYNFCKLLYSTKSVKVDNDDKSEKDESTKEKSKNDDSKEDSTKTKDNNDKPKEETNKTQDNNTKQDDNKQPTNQDTSKTEETKSEKKEDDNNNEIDLSKFENVPKNLEDYSIQIGSLLYIEKKSDEPLLTETEKEDILDNKEKGIEKKIIYTDYNYSPLCILYEEQKLKISVSFNEPLPEQTYEEKLEPLLYSIEQLRNRRVRKERTTKPGDKFRIEFNHAVRVSKDRPMKYLKDKIAKKLGLDCDNFRLRKSRQGREYTNMDESIKIAGIFDSDYIYIEYGQPTYDNQVRITFFLYDKSKKLTDPHKKRRMLHQLFDYSFSKDLTISQIKKKLIPIINKMYPPYRGLYNLKKAIEIAGNEENIIQQKYELEEKKKDDERKAKLKNENNIDNNNNNNNENEAKNNNNNNNLLKNSNTEVTPEPSTVDDNIKKDNNIKKEEDKIVDKPKKIDDAPKTTKQPTTKEKSESEQSTPSKIPNNLFEIEFIRIRKKWGAQVKEMLFDNKTLRKNNIMITGDISLAIEKCVINEVFTPNSLNFGIRRYTQSQGDINGKLYNSIDIIIDKNSTIKELKNKILEIYGKKNKKLKYENISLTKGRVATVMKPDTMQRLNWLHWNILRTNGIPLNWYEKDMKDLNTIPVDIKKDAKKDANKGESDKLDKDKVNNDDNKVKIDANNEDNNNKAKKDENNVKKEDNKPKNDDNKAKNEDNSKKNENNNDKNEDNKPKNDDNNIKKEDENDINREVLKKDEPKKEDKNEKIEFDGDKIEIPINKETGKIFTTEEIWDLQRKAMIEYDHQKIGVMNEFLYIRNGECVVFQDITNLPSKQNVLKQRIHNRQKGNSRLKKNPNFNGNLRFGSSKGGKYRNDDRAIKILTYEEWQEKEKKKKEEEERQAKEWEEKLKEKKLNKDKNNENNKNENDKNKNEDNNNNKNVVRNKIEKQNVQQTVDDYQAAKKDKNKKRKTSF